MRRAAALTAVLIAVVVALTAGGATRPADAAPAQRLCVLADPRIDEASGIAAGIASPDVFYVQNDSGDTNRFFAVDARTCRTRATITVPGARNVDWEDIAVARDAAGVPSVYLADIGDNDAQRAEVDVYRVAEPRIRAATAVRTGRPDEWRLRYPGGPVDAESLAVAPGGAAYVVTKVADGRSTVYALPSRPDAGRVRRVTAIGRIDLAALSGAAGGALLGPLARLATSAALSPDGALLAVRTYTSAYVWPVAHGDVAAALRHPPTSVALPLQPQGEGVGFAARALVVDSEGAHSAVYRVPLPATLFAAARASATPTSRATHPTSPAASRSASPTSSRSSSESGSGSWVPGIVILVLVVAGAIAWWWGQRGGSRRA